MLLFPADCYYGIVVVRSICRWIQIHLLLYRSFIRRAILNEGVLYRYLAQLNSEKIQQMTRNLLFLSTLNRIK